MRKILITLLALGAVCTAQQKQASVPRGNLAGVVVNAAGAAIPGAKVTISCSPQTKSDIANQEGQFLFPLLARGFYAVNVAIAGFKTAKMQRVEIAENKTSVVRITLQPGDSRETVISESNAIAGDAIDPKDRFYESVLLKNVPRPIVYAPGVSDPNAPRTSNDKRLIMKDLDRLPHGRSVGDIIEIY
jgi:hypothetical protein